MLKELEQYEEYLNSYVSKTGRKRQRETCKFHLRVAVRLGEFLAERGKKSFKEVAKDELHEFINGYKGRKLVWRPDGRKGWIEVPVKPGTRRNVAYAVYAFYGWLFQSNKPEWVEELKELAPRIPIVRVTHHDLLTEEEIMAMLQAAESAPTLQIAKRDRAIIAVLYEGAFRIRELLNAKLRDVETTEYGFRITVRGKGGTYRTIPLINSSRYLWEWLNVHPKANDPDAPLFVSLAKNRYGQPLRYSSVLSNLKEIAKKAGIEKNIHPHLFRHTRLTDLAGIVTESYLKKFAGWQPNSQMTSVYIHLSGRDLEREILRAYGIEPKTEVKPLLAVKVCEQCGQENDAHLLYCSACGSPLKSSVQVLKTMDEVEKLKEEVKELKAHMERMRRFFEKFLPWAAVEWESREAELEDMEWRDRAAVELWRELASKER